MIGAQYSRRSAPKMPLDRPKKFYAKNELARRYATTVRSVERWVAAKRYPAPDLELPNGRKRWSDDIVERHEKASTASAARAALKKKSHQANTPSAA
jgi:hypothetical protein